VTQHPETAAVVTERHKNVTMTINQEAFVTKSPLNVTQHPATAAVVTKRHQNVTMGNKPEAFVTK
jgi:phage regulator Rha-like protein